MLSKEQAQERLKSFHNPRETEMQVARLQKLSDKTSRIGQALIQAGPEWEKIKKEQNSLPGFRRAAQEQVGDLNSTQRQALFAALFPGTVALVEETWNLFDHLPYQTGYVRRPFRAPNQKFATAKSSWLSQFAVFTKGYQHQDVAWLAAWAAHVTGFFAPRALGYLFAAAIDKGGTTGDEVFNILVSSANGTHEIGMMGRHVVHGLLCSSRADGWEYIERMLLAAQREEGLRQSILEAIDEAHPQAFRRLLRVVVENNLSRFSAVTRACGVWFGLPFEAINQKAVNKILAQVLRYLENPADGMEAIKNGDAQDAYYAIWCLAFDDVNSALPYAVSLAHSDNVEKRFAAIHLIAQTNLQEALPELLHALDDDDLRIPARILPNLNPWEYKGELLSKSDLFERLERLLARIKHKQNNLKPLVWDWSPISLDRESVSGKMIDSLGSRPIKRLLPYLSMMKPWDRRRVAELLGNSKHKDEEALQTLLMLTGDASPDVRKKALDGLNGIALKESDLAYLENLLSRQAQDLRQGIIQLLYGLSDKKLIESLNRLINHKGEKQRLAALEILRECRQKNRLSKQAQSLAQEYKQRATLSDSETRLLDDLLSQSVEKYSLEDALGLMNPKNRTKPTPVKSRGVKHIFSAPKLITSAAIACLKSLDDLVEEHRNDLIETPRRNDKTTELLGNIRSAWFLYDRSHSQPKNYATFSLRDMADAWLQSRPDRLRDADGFDLIRAWVAVQLFRPHHAFEFSWTTAVPNKLQAYFGIASDFDLKHREVVEVMLEWLVWAHPAKHETDFILDALEDSIAKIPHSELTGVEEKYGRKSRILSQGKLMYLQVARSQREFRLQSWQKEHHARFWNLICWLNEPKPNLPGDYALLDDALLAFQSGAATRNDLFYMFLGAQNQERRFHLLSQFSGRKLHPRNSEYAKFPILQEIMDACRERILDVECRRGELPTAATTPAMSIRSVPGMRNLFRLLAALGNDGFARGYFYGQNRSGVFSHLIRNCYPLKEDTWDGFAEQARLQHIPEKRLIELAVYAPQWVDFVQHATGWAHLSDSVWWLYAHTKDRQWTVEQDIREEWHAWIAERTPLSADDLMDGAVDVVWFNRVYSDVGADRWQQLYDAALYTSGGIGHTRARLYSDAMLGNLEAGVLVERISKKRHQDSVRALGLIPLGDIKNQKNEILSRYEVMQEFLRTCKKFGSQRQASEKLAVSIGMQNLARTAGYEDPQRLEWAMEIESVSDLSLGPVTVNVDGYQFTLSIDDLGEPVFETRRNDKIIKAIPAMIKKNELVSALLERKHKLERQVSRMRLSLEQSMCRGDQFTAAELKTLFQHPMLRAMIEQLIFISPRGLGYPVKVGKALTDHKGQEILLANVERVRIAHPLDLLSGKEWHLWQHECFTRERIQPFKQVFRELYVLTDTEKAEGNLSRRYAGQQVNPRQAVALFGARGWVADPNEGVQRTFHEAGISARVGFLQGMFTPAEVEGLTLEVVVFTRRGEWDALPLEQVPPRIFSEVMRDLDLVVSVAHTGGVDPESSASSVEARAALIRETCSLLNLANVQLNEKYALIDGKLTNYNIHLGSGVVHKQPGGAICIIPVHSQHRGRLFLPFVDNDPKTAEIVSKVILLARDDQIKDPTILEQIL